VARSGRNAPPVNGDQVRDTRFCPSKAPVEGYDALEVDDLLRRVAAELDAGGSARPLIENTGRIRRRTWGRRYDIDAVDWFLGQFLLPQGHVGLAEVSDDPWHDLPVAQLVPGVEVRRPPPSPDPGLVSSRADFAGQYEKAWRDFDQVPGTHLWWWPTGIFKFELRTAEQQTLASHWGLRDKASVGGCKFHLKGRTAGGHSEPFARTWSRRWVIPDRWYPFVDETRSPVLYKSGYNLGCQANACVMFPDQRWLRFLVRGTRKANAIMTAVDQAGNKVARYRIADDSQWRTLPAARRPVAIIVHPSWKLTDELALALVISARWLDSYFRSPN
jgi:DivIVA domain-containing protein